VRFCCPHCRIAYYGTDENGQLVPRSFDCVGCGKPISMNDCVLLPSEGVGDEETKPERHPWFDRRRRWSLSGWWTMMIWALFMPSRAMRAISHLAPSGYLLALGTIFAVQFLTAIAWVGFFMLGAFGGGGGGPRTTTVVMLLGRILLTAAISVGTVAVSLAIWIVLAHGVLWATGRVEHGLRRTAHAFCYSAMALIPSAVPCCGVYLMFVLYPWWVISAGIMLAEAQQVNGVRAALAVLAWPSLLILGPIALIMLFG